MQAAAPFGPGPAPAGEWRTVRAEEAFGAVLEDLRPTTEAALQEAQALAQKLQVMVYGSVTGRFTAQDADADFTLLLPWDERDSGALRAFQQRVLVELRRELLARGWHVSTVGLGGRVPVLTFHWGPGLSRSADMHDSTRAHFFESIPCWMSASAIWWFPSSAGPS